MTCVRVGSKNGPARAGKRCARSGASGGRRVTFKVKDYRIEGPGRYTTTTLDVGEFIRRFLIHVLPKGFHRLCHYGLFAGSNRAETIDNVRNLLNLAPPAADASAKAQQTSEIDPVQLLANPPLDFAAHDIEERNQLAASVLLNCRASPGAAAAQLLGNHGAERADTAEGANTPA
jgi:hypothetical protein